MGDRARLGHVDRVARGLQPGRDDVAELDQLADLAVAGGLVDPVVVPIGDQEPAAVGLQRVLDSGRDVDRKSRRIAQGERADVRDHGEAVGAVDSVDADDVVAADVGTDNGDQCVRRPADERYVDVPPTPSMIGVGRPLAKVVILPVLGSTREILPAALSVT